MIPPFTKLQATSYKFKSNKVTKLQATSYKLQATSYKLQVTSYKLQAGDRDLAQQRNLGRVVPQVVDAPTLRNL